MTDTHANPPRVAQALLRALVRPSESECIPGDLLEEYREVRRPTLGRPGADRWYIRQVLSVLWRVTWPPVVAIVALRILSFPIPGGWNPSVVPAPGLSLLDALILAWAGYSGTQRTGRIGTGLIAAGVTSLSGVAVFFVYVAVMTPGYLLAPIETPFIIVIASILLAMAVAFGIAVGSLGAVVSRWMPARRVRIS